MKTVKAIFLQHLWIGLPRRLVLTDWNCFGLGGFLANFAYIFDPGSGPGHVGVDRKHRYFLRIYSGGDGRLQSVVPAVSAAGDHCSCKNAEKSRNNEELRIFIPLTIVSTYIG